MKTTTILRNNGVVSAMVFLCLCVVGCRAGKADGDLLEEGINARKRYERFYVYKNVLTEVTIQV